jgi:hypothetical protein
MASLNELTERNKRIVENTYLAILGMMRELHTSKDKALTLRDWARMIGGPIYDIKGSGLETNLYSSNQIEIIKKEDRFSVPKSPDHAFSRLKASKIILREAQKSGFTLKRFWKLLQIYCYYHYLTSEENRAVKAFVDKGWNWIDAYKEVGIQLYEITTKKEGCKKIITSQRLVSYKELKIRFAH